MFEALVEGREEAGSKAGLASLLKTIWGKDYEDERDARFINDRVHANVQKDRTFSVVPRIYGGVTSAAELRRIADVADKYSVPMVKITGGQRIDLARHFKGKPSQGLAGSRHAVRTCLYESLSNLQNLCRHGVLPIRSGRQHEPRDQIERRFQGIESPHKMKLATAGCPRNCSEATTKDLEQWPSKVAGGKSTSAELRDRGFEKATFSALLTPTRRC